MGFGDRVGDGSPSPCPRRSPPATLLRSRPHRPPLSSPRRPPHSSSSSSLLSPTGWERGGGTVGATPREQGAGMGLGCTRGQGGFVLCPPPSGWEEGRGEGERRESWGLLAQGGVPQLKVPPPHTPRSAQQSWGGGGAQGHKDAVSRDGKWVWGLCARCGVQAHHGVQETCCGVQAMCHGVRAHCGVQATCHWVRAHRGVQKMCHGVQATCCGLRAHCRVQVMCHGVQETYCRVQETHHGM